MRNIIQMWAINLSIDITKRYDPKADATLIAESKAPGDDKTKKKGYNLNPDETTYLYLLSIANAIELERITLVCL